MRSTARSFTQIAAMRSAAGSDFSPGPFAPLMGIQGMVTRKGWDGIVRTVVGGRITYEA